MSKVARIASFISLPTTWNTQISDKSLGILLLLLFSFHFFLTFGIHFASLIVGFAINCVLFLKSFRALLGPLFSAEVRRYADTTLSFVPRSRYAESVLPLLIVAQRKLQEQINDHGGPSGSQPLITVSKETGIAEEFFIKPSEYMSIEPAVHIDPEGHDVYRGSLDALRLVSVPLDVNKSLQALHQALELKHHTARSLDHSRQLLLCYLAGQQEGKRIRYASKCKSRWWNRSDETLLIVMITTAFR